MSTASWGRATRQGIIWSTASFVAGRTLTFVSIVVLARLLTPGEFGVVAAITAFLMLIEVVSDVGMKATVVYEQEHGITARVQTAFTVNLGFAFLLVGATLLLAPFVAGFFRLDEHVDLFRLASLNLLLTGLGNVHDSLLLRELDFRRRIIPDLVRQLTRGVVSIVLALAGLGAEALVIGMLAGTASWTVVQWTLTPFRPTLSLDAGIARSMAGYGSGSALLAIVGAVGGSVQIAMIGRALGEQALGLYVVARRIPELLIEMVAFNVSRVAFPALARRRARDKQGVGPAMLVLLRYQALYVGPAAAGLAVLAQPLVTVVFSSTWRDAGSVLTAVAVLSGVGSIAFPLGDVLKAVGKQWFLVALNVIQIPLVAAGILLLAPRGIDAVAWLVAGSAMTFAAGMMVIVSRELGIRARSVVSAARPGMIAALGVTVGAGAVRLAWPDLSIAPLVAGVLAGTGTGILFLRVLAPGVLSETVRTLGYGPGSSRATGASEVRGGDSPTSGE